MIANDYIITALPKTVIYIPNFITSHEETEILNKVFSAPIPKWTQLKNRRLQNWGGIPHPRGMIPEKMPDWLQKYLNRISALEIFEKNHLPNHVLVNEYKASQGIMPHVDGPLFHPIISTINCGSHTVLNFQKTKNEFCDSSCSQNSYSFSLLLEPRSLLVLKDNLYTDYLHSIDEIHEDIIDGNIRNLHCLETKYASGQRLSRSTRISLTIRNVPRCSNFKLKF